MTVKQHKFYRIYLQFLFVFFSIAFFWEFWCALNFLIQFSKNLSEAIFFPGDALVYNFI